MRDVILHIAGAVVLMLNKIRYGLRGYREPRPFSPTDYERAIDYDHRVVANWLKALDDYTGGTVNGKAVLELGPGADLGPALFLLDAGAKSYVTVDANRLIDQTPPLFYEKLLHTLNDKDSLKAELEKTLHGNDDRITYLVDPTFNLSKLERRDIDVVVSQAAFEHFSNVDETIYQLSQVVKPGGVLIAEVDLLTHTGALRSRDPLNIYRYSKLFYQLVRFSGIPNRVRPTFYKEALERHGWYNVEVIPLQTLPDERVEKILPHLARPFRKKEAQMHILTFLLCATKR